MSHSSVYSQHKTWAGHNIPTPDSSKQPSKHGLGSKKQGKEFGRRGRHGGGVALVEPQKQEVNRLRREDMRVHKSLVAD